MGFKCGIVGLPNVGKSTLFNALTQAQVAAANYPFCTIEPNVGRVPVPDPRLAQLAELIKPARLIPNSLEFVDIAGLVAGAASGEGLGNQFLAHIREVDAIAHVVRCFEDEDIAHVAGSLKPDDDIATINTELLLADLATTERAVERNAKQAKAGDKHSNRLVGQTRAMADWLGEGNAARLFPEPAVREALVELHLLTAKPLMYIANTDEAGLHGSTYLEQVQRVAAAEQTQVLSICAAVESELAGLAEADRVEFLADMGLREPGLHRLIQAGYDLLGLLTFFTAGPKEVRAWTVVDGATAPAAAGRIHSDFEKGFIRAEIVAFADYIHCRGEQGAKDSGKWRLEGKDYRMQEGDVVHFRFNV